MHVSFYKLKYIKRLHSLWPATNTTDHHSASAAPPPLTHPNIPTFQPGQSPPKHPYPATNPPSSAPHCPVQRVGRPKPASDHSPAPPRRQQPECRLSTNAPLGGRGAGRWGPGIGRWREGGRGCGRSSRLSLHQAQTKAHFIRRSPLSVSSRVLCWAVYFYSENVICDILRDVHDMPVLTYAGFR